MSRRNVILVSLAASLLVVGVSCGNDDDVDVDPATTTTDPPTTTTEIDRGAGELPNEVLDSDRAPAAELFLPQLDAYRTDDDVDAGEMRASLDGGDVPYEEVRRRLVVDEQGFTRAEVMVVTFPPEGDPDRFISHWYGAAARTPVDIAGADMERVATDPFDAVVWLGPRFAVAFERGQEMTDEELLALAAATVEVMRAA